MDDNLRDDNDCSDLEKKSTGDKRKQRDELDNVFILDNERREYEDMIAMAKRQRDKLSEDDRRFISCYPLFSHT